MRAGEAERCDQGDSCVGTSWAGLRREWVCMGMGMMLCGVGAGPGGQAWLPSTYAALAEVDLPTARPAQQPASRGIITSAIYFPAHSLAGLLC